MWKWMSDLLGYHWGPSSLLEVIWTSAAAVGIVATLWLGWQASLDLVALHEADNFVSYGPRHIIARGSIRNTLSRLLLFTIFFAIGIWGMQTYPAHPNQPPTPYAVVLGLGLIAAEFAMMIDALFDHHDRIEVIRVMRYRKVLADPYTGEGSSGALTLSPEEGLPDG